MIKKSNHVSILTVYGVLLVFFVLVAAIGIGLVMNLITSADPSGNRVKNSWPEEYTRNFSVFFDLDDGVPEISRAGIKSLDANRLWIQILDENGKEVFAHNTTHMQAKQYSPIDFLTLYQGGEKTNETVFVDRVTTSAGVWTYVIGFPMHMTKVTMLLNGEGFTGGKPVVMMLASAAALLMLVGGGLFGLWMMRHMKEMTRAIGQISYRLYEPVQRGGPFREIYDSLNQMNSELLKSDHESAQNEVMREEWITNITHDLKTPLSPIRGYGEMLADPDHPLSAGQRVRYGQIIVRNTAYAEKLVNDLKLTYQLKNNMLPLDKKERNLVRFLKELVIEMLNHPAYADRTIRFDTDRESILFHFDETLFKRAMTNLIENALIHNDKNTVIHVSLQVDHQIILKIKDDGSGLTPQEKERLFERYYRGANTRERAGGTGLGMAIAKQIIEIHGGKILAESQPGEGTCIVITLGA